MSPKLSPLHGQFVLVRGRPESHSAASTAARGHRRAQTTSRSNSKTLPAAVARAVVPTTVMLDTSVPSATVPNLLDVVGEGPDHGSVVGDRGRRGVEAGDAGGVWLHLAKLGSIQPEKPRNAKRVAWQRS